MFITILLSLYMRIHIAGYHAGVCSAKVQLQLCTEFVGKDSLFITLNIVFLVVYNNVNYLCITMFNFGIQLSW